jgi:hypothetical protein
MHAQLKISKNEHTGHIRPHEHTSYFVLGVIVLLVGIILVSFSVRTIAAGNPPPQSGSVGLTGSVPTTPPKIAATINASLNGQHFTTSPITVSGTCSPGVLVEIYKNNIFGGSTPCGAAGTYSISVDLLYGQNSLVAQVYDVLNQSGPQSNTVTVYYDSSSPLAAPASSLNFSGSQLLLNTNAVYRGTFPNQVLNVPISVIGGVAPFAINVEWGDSSNKIIPVSDNTTFNAAHTYNKPGTYKITLQATDSKQQVAFLTVAAIVNGQPGVISTSNISYVSKASANKLLVLWPLYAIVVTLVVSFWMGERREKHVLNAAAAPQPSLGITPTYPHPQK